MNAVEKVHLKIDGIEVSAKPGVTILEAAGSAGIRIPTLCHLKDCAKIGACRMCVVEVKGQRIPVTACTCPVAEGMEVVTNSPALTKARTVTLNLLCSEHRMDCEFCSRYSDCEFHALIREYGIDDRIYAREYRKSEIDKNFNFSLDTSKCVMCRRCVDVCSRVGANVLNVFGRGADAKIGAGVPLALSDCIHCGQCTAVCPTGALSEKDETSTVWHYLEDPTKYMVAIVSPEVCAQLGESFAEGIGTDVSGKIPTILRALGFQKVYNLSEGRELAAQALAEEIKSANKPVATSFCPAFKAYCERKNLHAGIQLSSAPTPAVLLSERCKQELNNTIEEKTIFVVDIEACLAAKLTAAEEDSPIDIAISTRELASVIRRGCVSRFTAIKIWRGLTDSNFDTLDIGSGSHMSSEMIAQKALQQCGFDCNGLATKYGLDGIDALGDKSKLISVFACPKGCMNGGGQPKVPADICNYTDFIGKRNEIYLKY